jgi:hypothetical protein
MWIMLSWKSFAFFLSPFLSAHGVTCLRPGRTMRPYSMAFPSDLIAIWHHRSALRDWSESACTLWRTTNGDIQG